MEGVQPAKERDKVESRPHLPRPGHLHEERQDHPQAGAPVFPTTELQLRNSIGIGLPVANIGLILSPQKVFFFRLYGHFIFFSSASFLFKYS